jgi:hypothetical protein
MAVILGLEGAFPAKRRAVTLSPSARVRSVPALNQDSSGDILGERCAADIAGSLMRRNKNIALHKTSQDKTPANQPE